MEEIENEYFSEDAYFYKVLPGLILVKQSIFGSTIVKGKIISPKVVTDNSPDYQEVETIVEKDIIISELSDKKLDELYPRLNDAQKTLIDNVKKVRAGLIPETPEIKNATIKAKAKKIERRPKIKRPNIIIKRVEAKLGIKFRWPWQSALLLTTNEQHLNTAPVKVKTKDNVAVEVDTDYWYKIIDVEAYVKMLNGFSEKTTKPTQALKEDVSTSLDNLVIDYIITHNYEELMGKTSVNLLNDLRYEVGEIEQKYGIEVNKFNITSINLPQSLLDAEMKLKTASTNAAAAKAEKNVENEILGNLIELLKNQGLSSEQIASYLTTKGAKNATVFNIPNSLLDSIFNGQKNSTTSESTQSSNPEPIQGSNLDNSSIPNPAPQNNGMSEKAIEIWNEIGFCDEDGCLSRDDSKVIMSSRGATLEPGRVLMIYELNKGELQILKDLVMKREMQDSNNKKNM